MFKKIMMICAVASSLILSQGVLAKGWCGQNLNQMVHDLNLDDVQKAKVKSILSQMNNVKHAHWAQMADLDIQIKQQMMSDKMDMNVLNSLVDQKAKVIGDDMKAKLVAQNQVMAVLNAKQKTELQAKLQAMHDKISAKYEKCAARNH